MCPQLYHSGAPERRSAISSGGAREAAGEGDQVLKGERASERLRRFLGLAMAFLEMLEIQVETKRKRALIPQAAEGR